MGIDNIAILHNKLFHHFYSVIFIERKNGYFVQLEKYQNKLYKIIFEEYNMFID